MKFFIVFLCLIFSIACKQNNLKTCDCTNTKFKSKIHDVKKKNDINTYVVKKHKTSMVEYNDTIKSYILKNKIYGNNTYILVHSLSNDKTRDQIDFYKNKKLIKSIMLPIPDIEVKNFQLDNIEETHQGFYLTTSNGGGNNLYINKLFFEFDKEDFYLYKQERILYDVEKDATDTIVRKFNPKIEIDKIKLLEFYK